MIELLEDVPPAVEVRHAELPRSAKHRDREAGAFSLAKVGSPASENGGIVGRHWQNPPITRKSPPLNDPQDVTSPDAFVSSSMVLTT